MIKKFFVILVVGIMFLLGGFLTNLLNTKNVVAQSSGPGKYQFFTYSNEKGEARICVGDTVTGDARCSVYAMSSGTLALKGNKVQATLSPLNELSTLFEFKNPF